MPQFFPDFLFSDVCLLFLSRNSSFFASAFDIQLLFRLLIPIQSRRNNAARYCYANISLHTKSCSRWAEIQHVRKKGRQRHIALQVAVRQTPRVNFKNELLNCCKLFNWKLNTSPKMKFWISFPFPLNRVPITSIEKTSRKRRKYEQRTGQTTRIARVCR